MKNPIKFTKDGQERYVSNLYEFIKLIYNDNQRINESNVTKLFDVVNDHEGKIRDIYKHVDRLYKKRAGIFLTACVGLGVVAWYRTKKQEKRIKELEELTNFLMEENEDKDLIFDIYSFDKGVKSEQEDDKKEE